MNKAKRPTDWLFKLFFTLLFSLTLTAVDAQEYQEDFGTAAVCTDIDTVLPYGNTALWRVYYGANNSVDTTNRWFISARESNEGQSNCSDGCAGGGSLDQTLHISTNSGSIDPSATYNTDSIADIWVYAPTFDVTGTSGDIRIEFDYLEVGDSADDNATFVVTVGSTFLTPNYGTFDLQKTNTTSCTNGEWSHYVLFLDATVNTQTQLNLGFHWVNDGDGNGATRSFAVDNFEIYESDPKAGFDVSDSIICVDGTIDFSDTSLGNPNGWVWQFGGSAIPTAANTQNVNGVQFTSPGTHTITLTVGNNNGSNDTTLTIQVDSCYPPTPAFFTPDTSLCQGQCISFADVSIPGAFGTGGWVWQFQGATPNTSTDQNPQNICYPTTGIYNITLTVVDTLSGKDSTILFPQAISVGTCQIPVAAFITDTNRICNNDFVEFYSIATGNPDSIRWDFGTAANPSIYKASSDSADTVQVLFPTPGTYTITMTVWNGAGIDDTIGVFQTIIVDSCPPPIPDFTVSSRTICPGVAVVFEDLSQFATEWEWEFIGGIPSVSIEQNPEVRYDSAGIYPVTLIVKNVNGDSTLVQLEFIVVDSCLPPNPKFEVERDSICRGSCVKFINTSDRADSIFWIFWWHPDSLNSDTILTLNASGDTVDTFYTATDYYPMFIGTDSIVDTVFMEQDPIYCFNDSGVVGVQLFAFNEYDVAIENAQDVPILNIGGIYPKMKPGPDKYVRIDNIDSRFYLDDTVKFDAEGTGPYWSWFPEEDLSCYDCPNPIIHPNETKKYIITNYDDYGCQAYDSVIVFVEESYYAGIPNIFSPNGDNNNDILFVRGNGISSQGFVFRIWNRFGETVYESFSQNDGWDGKIKGVEAPIGSYTFSVKLVFLDGTTEELKGNVTIVRY